MLRGRNDKDKCYDKSYPRRLYDDCRGKYLHKQRQLSSPFMLQAHTPQEQVLIMAVMSFDGLIVHF